MGLSVTYECSVLFYSDAEQLVGIAGKPNSVNALDVNSTNGPGQANGQLAGGCTSRAP